MATQKLALNHDNTAGLTPIYALQPPLFARYRAGAIQTEWHAYEGREWAANHVWRSYGKAWVAWQLYALSVAELALLKTYEGNVTITTRDKGDGDWKNYNGILQVVDLNENARWRAGGGRWEFVRVEIRDLEELS